jgi:hypothetical protein
MKKKRFARYLLHEMYDQLDAVQLDYFRKFLYSIKTSTLNYRFDEPYYINMFDLPKLKYKINFCSSFELTTIVGCWVLFTLGSIADYFERYLW